MAASPPGARWNTSSATGCTSPGFRAISTSSSTCTAWTRPPGPCTTSRRAGHGPGRPASAHRRAVGQHLRSLCRGLRIRQRRQAVRPVPPDGRLLGRRVRSPDRHQGLGRNDAGHDRRSAGLALSRRQAEHVRRRTQALFAGIRSGNPLNNGVYMARSTMLAIMGRMASLHRPDAHLGPMPQLDRRPDARRSTTGADVPLPPVAKPGLTRFV